MIVGSLFSGIGGIEIGFERQGYTTAWFIENDLYCQSILKKRFPDAKVYDDITKTDFRELSKVDVLTGGFPCQDISNAGKRIGIEGSRSSLWKYYAEAIRVLRPKFCFIENVSALIGRGLHVVLADLASLGYDAEWHCVSASCVGAPHRRDRVFILAYPQLCRCLDGQVKEQSTERRKHAQRELKSSCSDVSNTCRSTFSQEINRGKVYQQEGGEVGCFNSSICSDVSHTNLGCLEVGRTKREQKFSAQSKKSQFQRSSKELNPGWWSVEPLLGRVADGVPNRIHRIKCLGNAVVPQLAEVFAKTIKEAIT